MYMLTIMNHYYAWKAFFQCKIFLDYQGTYNINTLKRRFLFVGHLILTTQGTGGRNNLNLGTFPVLRSRIGRGRNSARIVYGYANISDIYLGVVSPI